MAVTQALDALGPDAKGIQPVFIAIDPERDNKVLADYVFAFHHSLVGLTGSPEEIRKSPTPTSVLRKSAGRTGNARSTTPASSI
jgi:cytochrome oxidase Cu insertion factor (SCO1/SenC/PrrC family)